MTAHLLDPIIMDLMVDKYSSDERLVSKLSQTCKAYSERFQYSDEMQNLTRRLNSLDGIVVSDVWTTFRGLLIARNTGRLRTWYVSDKGFRGDLYYQSHWGTITVGKCSARLRSLATGGMMNTFTESFYKIPDFSTLQRCLAAHSTLYLPKLPECVVHHFQPCVIYRLGKAQVFSAWRASVFVKEE